MPGNANYDTALLTMTLEKYLSTKPADAIFDDLVLIEVLRSRAKTVIKGGYKLLEPLMYGKSTSGGSYSGYDTLDVTPQEGFTNAEFDWKEYYWSITISQREEDINSGEQAVIDLLASKWEQARMSMLDDMNADLYLDGTGNSSKDVTGLALMVDSAGTYGNIARASNAWWSAQETAAGGVLNIAGSTGLRRIFNDAAFGKGKRLPNLGITTQIIFEAYEAMMDPNMRFTNTGEQNVGFKNDNLMFRSMPLFWDADCQSQTFYLLNTEFIKYVTHANAGSPEKNGFQVIPFRQTTNQTAKVAQLRWMGNLSCSNARHQAKLTGVTNS